MEALLTIEEATRLLRVRTSTLYTWAYRRQIPSQKVCNALRFQREELFAGSDLRGQASTIQQSWQITIGRDSWISPNLSRRS